MNVRSFTTANCIIYAVGIEKELQRFEAYLNISDNKSRLVCEDIINELKKYENIYGYSSSIKREGIIVSRQINEFLMRRNRLISEDAFLEAIAVSDPVKFSELTGMSEEEIEDVVKTSFWTKLFRNYNCDIT